MNTDNQDGGLLVEVAETPSPRMEWYHRNGLRLTTYSRPHSIGGWPGAEFVCHDRSMTRSARGSSELEATLAYASAHGLDHWHGEMRQVAAWTKRPVIADVAPARQPEIAFEEDDFLPW